MSYTPREDVNSKVCEKTSMVLSVPWNNISNDKNNNTVAFIKNYAKNFT